ncbi:MAG: hypothetical protein A3C43_12280 [Candidatus Schekmanbacteria bacterium RIFCSPHIGHO2_02_FULL_38_11]|uniref:PIN domain-containing protein n=1 Tax=Candidatus Schekmanbacteria bacterium RIFCSPLOWO2_12_FULL_38_15 TaxID=1817883 RepID=A0A1F7SHT4_9BACT|nr:MAG: hypothetical protein A2043_00495 [Candidatus Schekmanbacteria bacterium GWA2_38_9]OGL50877.1 MAG: hypothetical protein A3H37_03445 [Candidatus Schekmanbacteria bacterium RIFCSPLOWO2_02_FULL_38_14]OGL53363.1 MAG: hypothetical protein A3G31_07620 [Candidatus Schekmanbacteria bacterium RIFCSPLOWO2_12_FULL_38_15]OGL55717.1 MAG: hypothetical protein A3C43_12280 [Candidatus Schekmanbacteria bacterium RIFCSPHIGHO2_02_FULL_38_11]
MKVIVDTDIYIDYFNKGTHEEIFLRDGYFKYLAPIIITELLAGCKRDEERKIIEKLRYISEKSNRIVLHPLQDYITAGNILNTLKRKMGYDVKKSASLTNDVFIAISAWKIGAILFTKNGKDFKAIQSYIPFKLEIVEQTS